jgi:hypothetical protein
MALWLVETLKTPRDQLAIFTSRWTRPFGESRVMVCTVSGATHREAPHPLSGAMQCRFPVLILYLAWNLFVSTKTVRRDDASQYYICSIQGILSPTFPQGVEKRLSDATDLQFEFKSVKQPVDLLIGG